MSLAEEVYGSRIKGGLGSDRLPTIVERKGCMSVPRPDAAHMLSKSRIGLPYVQSRRAALRCEGKLEIAGCCISLLGLP